MKNVFISTFLVCTLSAFCPTLNAVWSENKNIEIQSYNPADYDPWIPIDWIMADWTFWE